MLSFENVTNLKNYKDTKYLKIQSFLKYFVLQKFETM